MEFFSHHYGFLYDSLSEQETNFTAEEVQQYIHSQVCLEAGGELHRFFVLVEHWAPECKGFSSCGMWA